MDSSARGILTCFCGSKCRSIKTSQTHLRDVHRFEILKNVKTGNQVEENAAATGTEEDAAGRDAEDMEVDAPINHGEEPPAPANTPPIPAPDVTNLVSLPVLTSSNNTVATVMPESNPQSSQAAFSQ
jgi:hypothetical protein